MVRVPTTWSQLGKGGRMNTNRYTVDVPNPESLDGSMICLGTFDTETEALTFARERLGCDEDGKLQVVRSFMVED